MANEKINLLIDEINGTLDTMEDAAGTAGEIKATVRRVHSLKTAMEELPESLVNDEDFKFLDRVAEDLTAALPVKTPELEARLSMARRALDAAGLLPDVPEEALEAVLARAEAVFAAKPTSAKKPTVRGIGVPIRVDCGCGSFTRESTGGDWTSIRYQAKKHAEECSVACPDETGEFTLHFDNARHAIVDERQSEFKAGGLTFSLT